METILIKHNISNNDFNRMAKKDINKIVNFYSGRLVRIEQSDDKIILIISAPSTWKYILMNSMLLPYRFA